MPYFSHDLSPGEPLWNLPMIESTGSLHSSFSSQVHYTGSNYRRRSLTRACLGKPFHKRGEAHPDSWVYCLPADTLTFKSPLYLLALVYSRSGLFSETVKVTSFYSSPKISFTNREKPGSHSDLLWSQFSLLCSFTLSQFSNNIQYPPPWAQFSPALSLQAALYSSQKSSSKSQHT